MREVPRIVPPRGRIPAVLCSVELDRVVLEHARPAVAKADEAVLVFAQAAAHHGADHRVQAGAVPAAGEQADAHGADGIVLAPAMGVSRRMCA